MPTGDPFETYRWKREIERMEHDFRASANSRRERLEQLSQGEDDTVEFQRKVAHEMQEFLSESVSAAERVLGDISESGENADEAESEIRRKLEALIAGASPTGELEASPSSADAGAIRQRVLQRRTGRKPLDLRAALVRIQRVNGAGPSLPPEPAACAPPCPPRRSELLATFDETCHKVTHLLQARMGEDSVETALPLPEPLPGDGPDGDAAVPALRQEVARLRKAIDALVRKGLLSEADLL